MDPAEQRYSVMGGQMIHNGTQEPHTHKTCFEKLNNSIFETRIYKPDWDFIPCASVYGRPEIMQSWDVTCLSFAILFFLQFCMWLDGLNALLGREMPSERTRSDLDLLLNTELKLQLLDLENIPIPDQPPPIPPRPKNFDYCYQFTSTEAWSVLLGLNDWAQNVPPFSRMA